MVFGPALAVYWTLRLILSFAVLYMIVPRVLLGAGWWNDRFEAFYGFWTLSVVLHILAVYPLAALRLYEVLSLAAIYMLVWYWRRPRSRPPQDDPTAPDLYELLDRSPRAGRRFLKLCRDEIRRARAFWAGFWTDGATRVMSISFLFVFGLAAYLRFYDGIVNAAPPLADSYVTLAWMKYITNRLVFHDGIYPHGFHIYLSTLAKFAAVDPLGVLKFTGPLNSLLAVFGLYFAARVLSGQPAGGLVAAAVYGIGASFLPCEFVRQAATNSQEFALVFLLPATVFTWRYLETGRRGPLLIAFASLSITGLVHSLIALFTGLGMAAAAAAVLLTRPRPFGRFLILAGAAGAAAVVAALPVLVGLALGGRIHEGVTAFMAEQMQWVRPITLPMVVASALPFLAIVLGLAARRGREAVSAGLCTAFIVLGSFAIDQAPRFGVSSAALITRSGEFLALAMALSAGVAWGALAGLGRGWWRTLWAVTTATVIVAGAWWAAPVPADPYKMQYNAGVEQYLRISREHRPATWLMVSDEEGYALAYGRGWHLMVGDFLERVDPAAEELVYRGPGASEPLDHEWIFLFHERVPYHVPLPEAEAIVPRRLDEERRLLEWVAVYASAHQNIEVYYEDDDIVVWLIRQPIPQSERFRQIWGR